MDSLPITVSIFISKNVNPIIIKKIPAIPFTLSADKEHDAVAPFLPNWPPPPPNPSSGIGCLKPSFFIFSPIDCVIDPLSAVYPRLRQILLPFYLLAIESIPNQHNVLKYSLHTINTQK